MALKGMGMRNGEDLIITHFIVLYLINSRVIKSRRLRWEGHVVILEEGRSVFKILTGKTTGKRPLVTPKRTWDSNVRMDLKEIIVNARNWVDYAHERDYFNPCEYGIESPG